MSYEASQETGHEGSEYQYPKPYSTIDSALAAVATVIGDRGTATPETDALRAAFNRVYLATMTATCVGRIAYGRSADDALAPYVLGRGADARQVCLVAAEHGVALDHRSNTADALDALASILCRLALSIVQAFRAPKGLA
jgi:hypothetical protein